MTTLTETNHAGEFIAHEANGTRSREEITIADGNTLEAGAVLGRLTADGKYVEYDKDGVDGSEDASGILYDAVTADGADANGVAIVRDCEVVAESLVWPDGYLQADKDAALAVLAQSGVIAR